MLHTCETQSGDKKVNAILWRSGLYVVHHADSKEIHIVNATRPLYPLQAQCGSRGSPPKVGPNVKCQIKTATERSQGSPPKVGPGVMECVAMPAKFCAEVRKAEKEDGKRK